MDQHSNVFGYDNNVRRASHHVSTPEGICTTMA